MLINPQMQFCSDPLLIYLTSWPPTYIYAQITYTYPTDCLTIPAHA